MRVRAIRGFAVKLCSRLLGDDAFVNNAMVGQNGNQNGESEGSAEVLWAAAWICGEYSRFVVSYIVASSPDVHSVRFLNRPRS